MSSIGSLSPPSLQDRILAAITVCWYMSSWARAVPGGCARSVHLHTERPRRWHARSPRCSMNCKQLHLIDPHFGPENGHRKVLEALMNVADHGPPPEVVRVHCSAKTRLAFFEDEAAKMAGRLPAGATVEFVRWAPEDPEEKSSTTATYSPT